jgi:HTH-type transcriptional regulator/antitoxin HigA
MNKILRQAMAAWPKVAPLLTPPADDDAYDRLAGFLEELTDLPGNDTDAEALIERISVLIEAYDDEHHPMPASDGTKLLRAMISQHDLRQSDIPEIGAQSVVSAILAGKRRINVAQARALHARWPQIPFAAWLESDDPKREPSHSS